MAKELKIEAKVNTDSGWVELDPARVRITPGDTVNWVFTEVPEESRPALLFESFIPATDAHMFKGPNPPDPHRGPFGQLSRQGNEIHGSEVGELVGEYMYKICLLAADGGDPLVRKLECRNAPAGGIVLDPGPRTQKA